MKILITGGAGFIGSHLSEKYLESGNDVCVIDDLSTGSVDNIKHLEEDPRFKKRFFVVNGSILDEKTMEGLIKKCDLVIHLAAAVGVKTVIDHPIESINTNIEGTAVVLRLCNKLKKRVLITSSSEVYGKRTTTPFVETDDVILGSPYNLRWNYAAAKLVDELTALAYYKTAGLQVVVVRLFNTVGPRQTGRYGMVIPTFVKQALRNELLTVHGNGKQTRTFTHVDEVCDCMIKLMETKDAFGEIVNIGGVEEISIKDLAERVIKRTGSRSKIKFDTNFDDMERRVPSTEKLKSLIGVAPKKKVDEILDDVIRDIKTDKTRV